MSDDYERLQKCIPRGADSAQEYLDRVTGVILSEYVSGRNRADLDWLERFYVTPYEIVVGSFHAIEMDPGAVLVGKMLGHQGADELMADAALVVQAVLYSQPLKINAEETDR